MSNAATACARYSWTQSLPLPVIVERSYFLAHYCWKQSLLLPVTVERIYFLAHYCWTQSLPMPVTVKGSDCLCPLLLNAVTAYSRYCWTQSLPVPVTVNLVVVYARCCIAMSSTCTALLCTSFLTGFVSGAFAKFQKWLLASSCISVCLHRTTRLPLDGFLCTFVWGIFQNVCRDRSCLVRNAQEYQTLYMKT
jgi:hypothetical protein